MAMNGRRKSSNTTEWFSWPPNYGYLHIVTLSLSISVGNANQHCEFKSPCKAHLLIDGNVTMVRLTVIISSWINIIDQSIIIVPARLKPCRGELLQHYLRRGFFRETKVHSRLSTHSLHFISKQINLFYVPAWATLLHYKSNWIAPTTDKTTLSHNWNQTVGWDPTNS